MDGSTGRRRSPVVIGHEAARIVEEVGASVKGFRPGDRVTLESTIYTPECYFSQRDSTGATKASIG